MKTLLLTIAFLPTLAFAAPSGHRICRDEARSVELIYGTHALGFDGARLNVNGRSYNVASNPGEAASDVNELAQAFRPGLTALGARVGSASWNITAGEYSTAASAQLSAQIGNLNVTNLNLTCEVLDFRAGSEQDSEQE